VTSVSTTSTDPFDLDLFVRDSQALLARVDAPPSAPRRTSTEDFLHRRFATDAQVLLERAETLQTMSAVAPAAAATDLCPICQDQPLGSSLRTCGLGGLDSCGHVYCHPCIEEWLQVSNTCPLCKRGVSKLSRHTSDEAGLVKTEVSTVASQDRRVPRVEELTASTRAALEAEHDVVCTVCGGGGDDHLLILCDSCDSGYHTYCCGLASMTPNTIRELDEWYCPDCRPTHGSSDPFAPSAPFDDFEFDPFRQVH
jgi:hypothetical protein